MPGELTPKQQLSELVKQAGSILLLTHANPDGDALGSSLALKMGLEKIGKEVTVAVAGHIPQTFTFLPQIENIQTDLSFQKELLIILNENQAKVGNITLKRVSDTKLMVVVSPKDGVLTAQDVRIEEGSFTFDLLIILDCSDLERIGDIYANNPDLFYEVPIVNIDHHSTNVNFGKINIVDITASSTSEILVSLLETLGKDTEGMIDADIATSLLTGITTDTSSFQNANTTPKSLTVAAQMVAAGGRQQEIIQHVYKTRSLSQLRLWGRALAYLKEDADNRFVWSVLSKADFVASQADSDGTSGVIDELLKTAAGMDFVILLYERDNGIKVSLRSINPTRNVADLAALFDGGGHPQAAAFFVPDTTIADSEQSIISKIRASVTGTDQVEKPEIIREPELRIEQPRQQQPRRDQPQQPRRDQPQQNRPQQQPPRKPNA